MGACFCSARWWAHLRAKPRQRSGSESAVAAAMDDDGSRPLQSKQTPASLRASARRQVACRHRWPQFEFRSFWTAIERGNGSRTYPPRRGTMLEMGLAEDIRFSSANPLLRRHASGSADRFPKNNFSRSLQSHYLLRKAGDKSQRLLPAKFLE